MKLDQISVEKPNSEDGLDVHALVERCPPLDPNSSYCNLLQVTHFKETCSIARKRNEVVGFVSGYRLPDQPETLFVWQVAVDESARGHGLAFRMVQSILNRVQNKNIKYIQSTITGDNNASWALFNKLARHYDLTVNKSIQFDEERHFKGLHATEYLAEIGPIQN